MWVAPKNCGPMLVLLDIRCRNIIHNPKKPHNFENNPCEPQGIVGLYGNRTSLRGLGFRVQALGPAVRITKGHKVKGLGSLNPEP